MDEQATAYDPTELGPKADPSSVEALRDEDDNELPSFDSRHAEGYTGLLYLGALVQPFSWLGHDFVIRTLKDGEILAVAQIIKPYMDTLGIDRAYAMAVSALCTVSIDGEELPIPIGETKRINEWGHQRFAYVRDNWFPYTVTEVYNRYLALDDLVQKVIAAMGKASAPEDSTPSSNAI